MTPKDRALLLVQVLEDNSQRMENPTLAVACIRQAIEQAIEDDRRTRPTLVGAPMSDDDIKKVERMNREYLAARARLDIKSTGSTWTAFDRTAAALAETIVPLLNHITFLESVISDLRKELGQ